MRILACAIFVFAFSSTTHALNISQDVVWFDLSAWDHALASGPGQTLNNVFGDVDLFATVHGDFTLPTLVKLGGTGLASQNRVIGSQTFDFTLSEPLPLVVRYTSVDDQEMFDVQASSILGHFHKRGAVPIVSDIAGGKRVIGTSHFMTADGASIGYFELGIVDELSVTHHAARPSKFEVFQIGAIIAVPEPSGGPLALVAILWFLDLVRRTRINPSRLHVD
jgi:hypothetical protein